MPSPQGAGASNKGQSVKEGASVASTPFHPHVQCAATTEQTGHDHERTTTSEDDQMKLLGIPENAQI